MKEKKLNRKIKSKTPTSASKGITLIALIITIIVMLILVGVSVSVAINGGLFSTAKKAVTKTEEAKDSELRFMAMANAATHNEKWEYEVEGEKIPIPAGFAPTEIEGETSIEKGFVIIDAEGNEFVWIPCDDVTIYDNAKFENNSDWSSFQTDYTGKTWTDGEEKVGDKTVKEIKSKSIENNHGFYIARYEAGAPEEATEFYANKDGDAYKLYTEKNTNKYKPVSKKGYPAWNFISQANAKTVSENMYKDNVTVNSYLIDSYTWNYICKNILESKANKNITSSTNWGNYYDNDTTKYENLEILYAVHEYNNGWKFADGDGSGNNSKYHKGIIPEGTAPKGNGNNRLELSTGASDDFKAYNIYDMAGNMWEWTTETAAVTIKNDNGENKITTYAVHRGGSFGGDSNKKSNPVFAFGGNSIYDRGVLVGFRVVLYL